MLIRECADLISGVICEIFNKSLNSGVFPSDWKSARVTPLFKKGEWTDLNNYVYNSVAAKVFERIGFRTIHSTTTAPLEAADSWHIILTEFL